MNPVLSFFISELVRTTEPANVLKMLEVMWLQEKQELEEQRIMLMEEVQSYRNRIKQLEDDLLFRLSNSQARLDDT